MMDTNDAQRQGFVKIHLPREIPSIIDLPVDPYGYCSFGTKYEEVKYFSKQHCIKKSPV